MSKPYTKEQKLEYWQIPRSNKVDRCGYCLQKFGRDNPSVKYKPLSGTRFPTVHRDCLVLLNRGLLTLDIT